MRTVVRTAIAAGLLACLSSAAMFGAAQAQQAGPNAAHRNQQQTGPNYSYESYGLGTACSQHPFAPGCDKRGFW